MFGGTGVRSADPYHLEEYPYRLEAGTQNLAGIAGLSAGLAWIKKKGTADIYAHEMRLLRMAQDNVAEIEGIQIHGTKSLKGRVAALSITVENYDPSDVGTILDVEYNIQTRTGLQCAPLIHEHMGTTPRGTVRISMGPYNTEDEITTTIAALKEIAADRPAQSGTKPLVGQA
jgi:selenocysteine lyase/cysteine desulfurase